MRKVGLRQQKTELHYQGQHHYFQHNPQQFQFLPYTNILLNTLYIDISLNINTLTQTCLFTERKIKLRKARQLIQTHTALKQQNWGSSLESVLINISRRKKTGKRGLKYLKKVIVYRIQSHRRVRQRHEIFVQEMKWKLLSLIQKEERSQEKKERE